MHHERKKKAQKVVGKETDKLKIVDLLTAQGFSNEEIFEFTESMGLPSTGKGLAPASTSPNASLDLSRFNYEEEIKGSDFKEYIELVGDRAAAFEWDDFGNPLPVRGKLQLGELYDFELYRVEVLRAVRYKGVKDSPIDWIGIRVKDRKPVHSTRISVATAIEYNAQILNAHSIAGHGKYYLLKKV